jgi:shikimate dehydrogenase
MIPKAFVLGWPVTHSRSPLIHRFWLRRHGIEGDYVRQAVPQDAVEKFLRGLTTSDFVGGNVTVPHKEAAFATCDELTEVARRLGAVNTLWREGERLCGDNTDVHGFSANLDEGAPRMAGRGRSLLCLGQEVRPAPSSRP